MSDLKPCPFCGGTDMRPHDYTLMCFGCGAKIGSVKKWNARPVEDALRDIADKLYQACGPNRDNWPKKFGDEVVAKIRNEYESLINHG